MTKEYYQAHPDDVHKYWELFGGLILKAMTKTQQEDYTLEGCYHRLTTNQWQLFVILNDEELESIFVTSVIPFDLCCYLNPMFLAGVDTNKVDLKFMQECIEDVAKKFNCNKIMGGGRKGWIRVLSKFGYEDLQLVVKTL